MEQIKKTKKNTGRKIASWFLYLAVLAGLVYGIPKGLAYVLKTPYPMASITSGSMWPSLKKGDLVLIKGINSKDEIKIGDIVVYKNPQGFTIHRVISLNEKSVTTKGDANRVSDSPITYDKLIGKALSFNQKLIKLPWIGNISILLAKQKT